VDGSKSSDSNLPLTVNDAAAMLRSGELTSVALTTALLARADVIDPIIGTYVTRLDDYAMERAELADHDFRRGIDRGMYQGVPIGIKDILAVAAGPTTANSLILNRSWGHERQGPVVSRLERAGAVITGKLTTSEFAIGYPDPGKPFAIPRNPWDVERSAGGSSAGTANGIAAGLVLAGIGTDTGGSIRLPAAWNGVTGLKPTFGRVPKSGCVPLAYTLDHVGTMARSARDCAGMLQIIAGYHPSDESSADRPVDRYVEALRPDLTGVTIGVDRSNHFPPNSDPNLAECFEAALAVLVSQGAKLSDLTLPLYEETTTALWIMLSAEALAYHRADLSTRWGDYHELTRINVSQGALSSAADYVQAARVRRVAQHHLGELFKSVDVIATIPTAVAARTLKEAYMVRTPSFTRAIFTGYWNAVGNPTIAVPMGFNSDGLPLSLQLSGRPFEESSVLRVADAYQSVTDWHLRTCAPAMQHTTTVGADDVK